MKKFSILFLLFLLLFTTTVYASRYNTEYIINKVYDSTNTAFKATISGKADMTSITVDEYLHVTGNLSCDEQFVANKVTADMLLVTTNITADTVSSERLLVPHSAISPDGVGHGGGFSAPMGAMHYDKNTNILWINVDASEDWYGVQFLDSI